jgi:hypothetical protein
MINLHRPSDRRRAFHRAGRPWAPTRPATRGEHSGHQRHGTATVTPGTAEPPASECAASEAAPRSSRPREQATALANGRPDRAPAPRALDRPREGRVRRDRRKGGRRARFDRPGPPAFPGPQEAAAGGAPDRRRCRRRRYRRRRRQRRAPAPPQTPTGPRAAGVRTGAGEHGRRRHRGPTASGRRLPGRRRHDEHPNYLATATGAATTSTQRVGCPSWERRPSRSP